VILFLFYFVFFFFFLKDSFFFFFTFPSILAKELKRELEMMLWIIGFLFFLFQILFVLLGNVLYVDCFLEL
jgi:hypothetical protein